jgi:hypothetical protein
MVPELVVSQSAAFMAMSFGINNTRLHPPFFSLGRNLDGAFASLSRLADPRSLIGHLPFAISHLSEPNRSYSSRAADRACRLVLTDIVEMCLLSAAVCNEASLRQNLRSIGEQFIGIGSMSSKTFRSFLRDRFIYTRFKYLEALLGIVSEGHFKNKDWLYLVDSISSSVRHSMMDDHNVLPVDLCNTMGPEESLLKAQSYISIYGKMMIHWEDISDVATQICPSLEFWHSSLMVR